MRAAAGPFSPRVVAEVNALACELPDKLGLPLSRFSRSELGRQVLAAEIVAAISRVTIWRWLLADALRPWSRRSRIFARDPQLAPKAGRVLDLYHRGRNGRALTGDDFVISADEKTQAPIQKPVSSDHATGARPTSRLGTCTAPSSSARSSARSPIVALDAQVMALEPYRSAKQVFWLVDGGAIHRGQCAVSRHNSTTSPWRICSSTRPGSTRDLAHGIVSPGWEPQPSLSALGRPGTLQAADACRRGGVAGVVLPATQGCTGMAAERCTPEGPEGEGR